MTLARRTQLNIEYNRKKITNDLAPHLLSFSFTDNISNQADDLQLVLEDKKQLWAGDWMPEQGASLKASIQLKNWKEGASEKQELGAFEIDELEVAKSPSVVTLKALSVPESSSLRGERKNKAWEKTKLKTVANDIAAANKLKLFYDTAENPERDRIEQAYETDLEFLMRVCTDEGLCLKVSNEQIVIFDEEKYEQKEPFTTIYKSGQLIDYKGRITLTGIYKSCKVEYTDKKKKSTISYTFTPKNAPKVGRVLIVNEEVKSKAEAERLAKKKLREANKEGTKFTIIFPGDIRFFAGKTVMLHDFGKFDGKYIITQTRHSQNSAGYQTTIELRKCLEGY